MEQNVASYILSTTENTTCFECGFGPVLYASVNNGVLLCQQCGELHKQLPEAVSRIKNLKTDIWTDLDVELLVNGGNRRLWDLFVYYKVPRDANFDFKYKTRIGCYYRFMLMAIVKGEDPGVPPELNEALLFGSEQTQKREGKVPEDFWKTVNSYGNKSVEYTKKTFKDIKNTVSDPEWLKKQKEGLIQTGVGVGNSMKNVANETKEFFVHAKKESEEKGFFSFAKSLGEKGVANTKKGLSDAFGFVSKKLKDEPEKKEEVKLDEVKLDEVKPEPVIQSKNAFQTQGILIQQGVSMDQSYPGQKERVKIDPSSQEVPTQHQGQFL